MKEELEKLLKAENESEAVELCNAIRDELGKDPDKWIAAEADIEAAWNTYKANRETAREEYNKALDFDDTNPNEAELNAAKARAWDLFWKWQYYNVIDESIYGLWQDTGYFREMKEHPEQYQENWEPASTPHPAEPHDLEKVKQALLKEAADKPVHLFKQFDVFQRIGEGDDVIKPDSDGDSVWGAGTPHYELNRTNELRVMVPEDRTPEEVIRGLKKVIEWIESDPQSVNVHDPEYPPVFCEADEFPF